jgi:hypothetical protein
MINSFVWVGNTNRDYGPSIGVALSCGVAVKYVFMSHDWTTYIPNREIRYSSSGFETVQNMQCTKHSQRCFIFTRRVKVLKTRQSSQMYNYHFSPLTVLSLSILPLQTLSLRVLII